MDLLNRLKVMPSKSQAPVIGQNKKMQALCMPPQRVLDLGCGHAWAPLLAAEVFAADQNEQRVSTGPAWPRSSMHPFPWPTIADGAFLPLCCPPAGLYLLIWGIESRPWRVGA